MPNALWATRGILFFATALGGCYRGLIVDGFILDPPTWKAERTELLRRAHADLACEDVVELEVLAATKHGSRYAGKVKARGCDKAIRYVRSEPGWRADGEVIAEPKPSE